MKNIVLLVLCITTLVQAQETKTLDYFLPKTTTYNPSSPTPESVIGHHVGEWHITHDKLVQYMYAMAAASDRITIEDRGTTFEGRPLVLLTITSPSNHTNIDAIRQNHVALTEAGSNSKNIESMPAVVYQGFSIHGNEPSGANAALVLAYYLAAAQGNEINNLLDNTIILLDPSFNPDGLNRFATWVNMHKSQNINPDPNDREYDEVWPGGRTNHYWFDMNRDWLPVQLPESRARIKTFHHWYPNVLTDHHEMGTNSSFFFQPGIPSRTHPLTPKKNQQLTGDIAKFHAKALDKIGSFYYTEENFDDFYYGKGSTFPDINGSIGILFEQASSRGHAQESDNGILTFPFTIRNQFTAALSTLEASLEMRTTLLDYQRTFFNDARKEAGNSAIIFGDAKDANKTAQLAEILYWHDIAVHPIKQDVTVEGETYKKGNAFIVPKNQKHSRLIDAMFEKRTKFTDSLFYDISAWSFPLAFNMAHSEKASVSLAGDKLQAVPEVAVPLPTQSNYAYVMEWHDYHTPKALYAMLDKGLRAKVGMQPFTVEGTSYDYGTILIPVQNQNLNATEMHKAMVSIAKQSHVTITGVATGLTQGIDLGSNQFRAIKKPKVALIIGEGMNPYDAGEIWHLFDTRYDIPITKLDTRNLSRTDLSSYTDIIVVTTWGNAFDKSTTQKIKNWTQEGGSLITYKNAGRWLNTNELMNLSFSSRNDSATTISFEQQRDFRGAQVIGGAIFETKLDRSHPIAFGYHNQSLPVFRNSTLFLKPDKNSYNNPIQYTNDPLLSGYISAPNLKDLANTSAFATKRLGSGRVIYFTDNHNFRAFWYGTNKLLMNAIFFGDEM